MDFINRTHRQIIAFNKEIGHSYTPNLKARLIDNNGGYYIKTNSSGFRSNIEFKKRKEKKRILFFGDSNTAADGVSNEDRYSDLLGEYFDAEIFNYAISGTGTDQQYLIWEKYARDVQADLIIIGTLVENIERNKVQFRETIDYFTKKKTLTSKPYFNIVNGNLKLENFPIKKFDGNFSLINKDKVQWSIPLDKELLYRTINFLRNNQFFQNISEKHESKSEFIRSFLIKNFYQPHKDYKKKKSNGYQLMKKIIEKFIYSIKDTPIILMPIPTYHYYFDEAKPIYQDFFKSFENKEKKIFVIDLLDDLKKLNRNEKKLLPLKDDKAHFSKHGHEVIAKHLKDKIEILNLDVQFKKNKIQNKIENKTDKPTYVLGISAFYHDSAATLIKDGEIVSAAQEERFSRKKNDQSFPRFAINYCLEEAGINSNDLEAIVFYDNAYLTLERIMWSCLKTAPYSMKSWNKFIPRWLSYKLFIPDLIRKNLNYRGKILHNQHHRSHLASAFFPSPFKKSAILTIDGVGEWTTASIGIGEENKIKMIKEMSFPNSVGLLYSTFTQFLGFKVNSGEYKMMGLAPYGEPIYCDLILENLIKLKEDGSIKVNQKYFKYIDGSAMFSNEFEKLFKIKPRLPESKLTKTHMNIACSIQKITEKIVYNMAVYAKKITGAENLCLSGGVALNCVANGFLLKSNLFKEIWIQPASGDAGSSLGSAYDVYFSYLKKERVLRDDNLPFQLGSLFGPSWNKDETKSFLKSADINYIVFQDEKKRNELIANFINKGKVIGLFQGRTEFGPRALGSRSIVGDARNKDMQTRINLKIKFRESFRPFAPAILREKANNFFDLKKESPYMMLVAPVKKDKRNEIIQNKTEDMIKIVNEIRSEIPAVTHVDYSARVQTVDSNYNKKFYGILKEFEKQSNCPLIVNTSFNIRGEPIVNSPVDAFRCFVNTNMDILVIDDFIIEKNSQVDENFKKWKISKKKEKSIEKNIYSKELKSIYFEMEKIKINKNLEIDGWVDHSSQETKKIFEIPKELDTDIFDVEEMSNAIIKNWRDKIFANDMKKIIKDLLILSKKFKGKYSKINEKISENMYEMF